MVPKVGRGCRLPDDRVRMLVKWDQVLEVDI